MRKIIQTICLLLFFFIFTRNIYAQKIAGTSAAITYNLSSNAKEKDILIKRLTIKRVLEKYNAPMATETESFIKACKKFDLNCYLLPSISGLESTFGQFIYPNSYNPFGWGGGYIMFNSWNEGIMTVGQGLRQNYINKGANSIEEIGRIYSESPTWAVRVRYFINQFQKEQERLELYLNENTVKL